MYVGGKLECGVDEVLSYQGGIVTVFGLNRV